MPRVIIEQRINGQIGHPAASMMCSKLYSQAFETRATLNRIDKCGKQRDTKGCALDKRCGKQSNYKKLSTFFVDKCVHSFYKDAVSRFFESVFCFTIKKCAQVFICVIRYLFLTPCGDAGFRALVFRFHDDCG